MEHRGGAPQAPTGRSRALTTTQRSALPRAPPCRLHDVSYKEKELAKRESKLAER